MYRPLFRADAVVALLPDGGMRRVLSLPLRASKILDEFPLELRLLVIPWPESKMFLE